MTLHGVELNWIASFQGDGRYQQVMEWFSWLGSEALTIVLPLVYLAISSRAGARLYLLFSISDLWLHVLKLAFHSARPYWLDHRIKALSGSAGYGLPSGHTLSATIVWPSVARALAARWAYTGALVVVLLVSVSRVYLGVHFISDVVAAWGLAASLFWLFGRTERVLSGWLGSLGLEKQAGLALTSAGVFWTIEAGSQFCLGDSSWASAFSVSGQDLRWTFKSTGAFFGATAGLVLARQWARFEANGTSLWRRVGAYGYALAGVWLIREMGSNAAAHSIQSIQFTADFLAAAATNLWVLFVVPCLLVNVGVFQRPPPNEHQP